MGNLQVCFNGEKVGFTTAEFGQSSFPEPDETTYWLDLFGAKFQKGLEGKVFQASVKTPECHYFGYAIITSDEGLGRKSVTHVTLSLYYKR